MLEMTIDEAIEFFSSYPGRNEKRIIDKLKPLSDVGLGYIKMGQSSSTLSVVKVRGLSWPTSSARRENRVTFCLFSMNRQPAFTSMI